MPNRRSDRPVVAQFTTPGRSWPSLNGQHGHWRAHQALMNDWLARAIVAARQARVQPVDAPVVITATIHRTTAAKSDAHNVIGAVKACIDAAVKVGVIEDDNDGIVTRLVIERGQNRAQPSVTLRLEAC